MLPVLYSSRIHCDHGGRKVVATQRVGKFWKFILQSDRSIKQSVGARKPYGVSKKIVVKNLGLVLFYLVLVY